MTPGLTVLEALTWLLSLVDMQRLLLYMSISFSALYSTVAAFRMVERKKRDYERI